MHKLVRIEASPAYGTQFGLSFVWDGERVTGSNPHGTGGLADTFMIGWPLPKVGEALRRLADSLDMVARGAESERAAHRDYDGATLMEAWCAMAQAADEIERLRNAIATCPTPFCANADRVIWQPYSASPEQS